MIRRGGISSKVHNHASCEYCNITLGSVSCLICKKIVCDLCICDQKKYCFNCDSQNLRQSSETFITVPIDNNNNKLIKIKSKCCFM